MFKRLFSQSSVSFLSILCCSLTYCMEQNNGMNIFEAIKNGSLEQVKTLIASGTNVSQQDDCGRTPLNLAVLWGHTDIALTLIDACPKSERKALFNQRSSGYTPLHWAAMKDCIDITKGLIAACQEGERQALLNQRGIADRTPLHLAALWGHIGVAFVLLAAARPEGERQMLVNQQDNNGHTALHLAALAGHVDATLALFAACRESEKQAFLNRRDKNGCTPLHLAVMKGYAVVAKLLIARGANLDIQDNNGRTPAQCAYACGKDGLVVLLSDYRRRIDEAHELDEAVNLAIYDTILCAAFDQSEANASPLTMLSGNNCLLKTIIEFSRRDTEEKKARRTEPK